MRVRDKLHKKKFLHAHFFASNPLGLQRNYMTRRRNTRFQRNYMTRRRNTRFATHRFVPEGVFAEQKRNMRVPMQGFVIALHLHRWGLVEEQ